MFDVGFWELALLAVIALIVLGPERLPEVARTAGKWVGRARSYARGFTSELERQANVSGIREEIDRTRDDFNRTRDDIERTREGIESDTRDVVDDSQSGRHARSRDQESAPPNSDESSGSDESSDSDETKAGERVESAQETEFDDIDEDLRNIPDDLADYGEEEPFSVERARQEHARRDRESQ